MLLVVLTAGALAVLLLVLWIVRGGSKPLGNGRIEANFYPVDVGALRNLLSHEEEQFLRSALPTGQYHKVRRARLRAALGRRTRPVGGSLPGCVRNLWYFPHPGWGFQRPPPSRASVSRKPSRVCDARVPIARRCVHNMPSGSAARARQRLHGFRC